jgi:formylglycine-generating enzyme required for sulfatase activity
MPAMKHAIIRPALSLAIFGIVFLILPVSVSEASAETVVLPPEIGELDLRFRQLLKKNVTSVFNDDVAKLNAGYLGGIGRAIQAEQAAGRLDGVLALEAEKKRVEAMQPMPETDDEEIPAGLKDLRTVFRSTYLKLEAARTANLKTLAEPLDAHLAKMESDFTRGGRLEDAKAVRVYRVDLAAELATLGFTAGEEVNDPPALNGRNGNMTGTKAGEVWAIGQIELAWCPSGSFTMGSPIGEAGRLDDESQVKTTLSEGFWMATTETTQNRWKAEMKENPSYYEGGDLPVERMSWTAAQAYADKMNERHPLPEGWKWALPTEAQWEYACRAGTEGAFHYGATLDGTQAHIKGSTPDGARQSDPDAPRTATVGSYEPNAWGLFDMHGNVREWCVDWHAQKLPGGTDPTGPATGTIRVRRGGSWNHDPEACRSASRHKGPPDQPASDVGMRLAIVRASP